MFETIFVCCVIVGGILLLIGLVLLCLPKRLVNNELNELYLEIVVGWVLIMIITTSTITIPVL